MAARHDRAASARTGVAHWAGRHRGEPVHASESIAAPPARVLAVLSDPASMRRWFPVAFEFEPRIDKLVAGHEYPVSSRLAGRALHSRLDVLAGDVEHVVVRVAGPVVFDLDVRLTGDEGITHADVTVSVHSGGGLGGRLLTPAAAALLRSGALTRTIAAVRAEAEAR